VVGSLPTYVEFRSDRFPAYEGEEELVNPGVWGKRLAEFLRDGLRAEGFEAEEPIAEDWGWVLPIVNNQFRLWVGCGHQYGDVYLCFIVPHTPLVRRFLRRVDTRERVAELQGAMDKVLAEKDGIRGKRWWTHEEFNQSGR